MANQDIVAQQNIRAATLDDMITATSGAFLGLTINCARCHHHKFDPIPTEDYYRMRRAFEGIAAWAARRRDPGATRGLCRRDEAAEPGAKQARRRNRKP